MLAATASGVLTVLGVFAAAVAFAYLFFGTRRH